MNPGLGFLFPISELAAGIADSHLLMDGFGFFLKSPTNLRKKTTKRSWFSFFFERWKKPFLDWFLGNRKSALQKNSFFFFQSRFCGAKDLAVKKDP